MISFPSVSSLSYTTSLCKDCVSQLTVSIPLLKKIMLVVGIALGFFVIAYTLSKWYLAHAVRKLEATHKQDIREGGLKVPSPSVRPVNSIPQTEPIQNSPHLTSTAQAHVGIQDTASVKEKAHEIPTEFLIDGQPLTYHADVTFKNASCLEDAQVILVGEMHHTSRHYKVEARILNHFAKPHDIVLLEGFNDYEENEKKFRMTSLYNYDILEKPYVLSWDNLELVDKSIKIYGKFLKSLEELVPDLYEWPQQTYTINPALSLEQQQALDRRIGKLWKKFMHCCHERNRFLENAISKHLQVSPKSKIFVIAGQAHLVKNEPNLSYNLLDHLPQDVKYATIMFKHIPGLDEKNINMSDVKNILNKNALRGQVTCVYA